MILNTSLFKLSSVYKSNAINFDINAGDLLPFARALLSLSLLTTLLFNEFEVLFPAEILSRFQPSGFFDEINFFYNFKDNKPVCYLLSLIVLSGVILGFCPCLTGLLQWYLTFSFIHISPIVDGGDQINSVICFLLIPVNTLDFRFNQWHNKNTNSILHIYTCYICCILIQIQMSVIYFHAAIGKIYISEWADGTAIYYWLQHDIYGSTYWKNINFLFESPFLTSMITWGSILLEILLCCAIFMEQRWKFLFFLLGVLFHFLIFLFLGLFSFFLVINASLALYLLPMSLKIINHE
jgi:antimicrobial peptide system SdpB family protein